MGKLSYNAKRKIKTGLAIGSFTIAFGSIAGFATTRFLQANNDRTNMDLSDLPLMENDAGNKLYSKNQYCNILLTKQFEKEFFKNQEEDERKLAMIGLTSAVESFNALTNYYHYNLVAETNSFSTYGIQKNTAKTNIIPVTLGDDPNQSEYAETTVYASKNGQIQKCEMRFTEQAVFGVFDICEDYDLMFAPENSAFYTIAQHELGHTIGIKDFSYEEIYDSVNHKKMLETVMYYTVVYGIRTYTDYDKTTINDLVSRIDKAKTAKAEEEIEK